MLQVLDYVSQKAELYELQDALRNWERKVEIMEMAAKRARNLRRCVCMCENKYVCVCMLPLHSPNFEAWA